MCKAMEELIQEEVKEEKMEIAIKMLEDGTLSVEKIADYLGVTVEDIKAFSKLQSV